MFLYLNFKLIKNLKNKKTAHLCLKSGLNNPLLIRDLERANFWKILPLVLL